MQARDVARRVEPDMNENVAAKTLDHGRAIGWRARRGRRGDDGSRRQAREQVANDRDARMDLVDPNPDARVDIALAASRRGEIGPVVGRVGELLAPRAGTRPASRDLNHCPRI